MIRIREAGESDAAGIRELFFATYGDDYTYRDYYDEDALKRLVFGDDTLLLVAEDTRERRVVGTASVLLEVGAYSDLVGEFGRLVVHPEARSRSIGKRLMAERLRRVENRLHLGIMEARTAHPYTQRIAHAQGFAPTGFLPMKWPLGGRLESQALLVRYFGDALRLRRNHPRIVPEVYPLAAAAMANLDLPCDVIVDEEAAPYPPGGGFRLDELTSDGYASLLRIERGRVRNREVFGPLRLHYGFFKLTSEHSSYVLAYDDGAVAGALGYMFERFDRLVRIFELIPVDERSIRSLVGELVRRCRDELGAHFVEVDVRADAPRMQRTLLELGFLPAAYVPAMVFRRVERLDVVRMVRLLTPLAPGRLELVSPTREVADLVLRAFRRREVLPRIGEVVDRVGLFSGLASEQAQRLAGACGHRCFAAGETIFAAGEPAEEMFLVLDGRVVVEREGRDQPVGTVSAGECLGEVAMIARREHSATAVAATDVEVAVLGCDELTELVRQRPDIGVVVYRNLARELGEKLLRSDLAGGG
jgi:GNAT superfamily N-acetyltransferase